MIILLCHSLNMTAYHSAIIVADYVNFCFVNVIKAQMFLSVNVVDSKNVYGVGERTEL